MKTTSKLHDDAMTASKFCKLVNADRHELGRKIEELKAVPVGKKNGGDLYRLKDLIAAFVGGDEKAERVRKLRAESERLELQNLRSKGELVDVGAVKRLGQKVTGAIQVRIQNMPMTDDEKDSCLRELLQLRNLDFS